MGIARLLDPRPMPVRAMAAVVAAMAAVAVLTTGAQALPEIRTSATNQVPACVTPARLMQFLEQRNPNLPQAWRNIAELYKQHGERLKVRWDYAFYQMLLETNFLTYRTASGSPADVHPRQNNFAGLGTTGGGVPGDSFRSASDGVLGQMQHLVAYSGERVANPVAARTREVQDDVIALSRGLGRPVTFRDLAGRWAIDRAYGRSIEAIATRFRDRFCNGEAETVVADAGSSRRNPTSRQARGSGPGGPTRAAGASRRGIEEMDEPPPSRTGMSTRQPASETEETELAAAGEPLQDGEEEVASTDEPAGETQEEADAQPDRPSDGRTAPAAAPAPAEPSRPAIVINGAGRGQTRGATQAPERALSQPRPQPAAAAMRAPGTIAELIERQTQADPPRICKVFTASYGGERNVLIQSTVGNELHLTALQVLDGQEDELTASYIEEHAKGGRRIGEIFPSREIALLRAFELCPRGTRVSQQQ